MHSGSTQASGVNPRRLIGRPVAAAVVHDLWLTVTSEAGTTSLRDVRVTIPAGTVTVLRPPAEARLLLLGLAGEVAPDRGRIVIGTGAPAQAGNRATVQVIWAPVNNATERSLADWFDLIDGGFAQSPDLLCLELNRRAPGSAQLSQLLHHLRDRVTLEGRTVVVATDATAAASVADTVIDLAG